MGLFISLLAGLQAQASLPSGLWVGDVVVDSVSEIAPSLQSGQVSQTPVEAEGRLTMRVLLHSDGSGETHLLKWVTLMARKSENNDGEPTFKEILVTRKGTFFEADVVGRFPDGHERRGFRFFTTAYDWDGSDSSEGNQLKLGSGGANILTGTLVLDARHPSNPFYHRFHNQHQSGQAVTRTVRFTWAPAEDASAPAIGGFNRIAGVYQENIFGLNGEPDDMTQPQTSDPHIALRGRFDLRRVSQIDRLNDEN